ARAIEAEPGLPNAFALLAGAEERSSDALEAIERLAAIAEKDARFAPARVTLAAMYERLGRDDLAMRQLEAALADRPGLRDARVARARLCERRGDLASAAEELERLRREDARDTGV